MGAPLLRRRICGQPRRGGLQDVRPRAATANRFVVFDPVIRRTDGYRSISQPALGIDNAVQRQATRHHDRSGGASDQVRSGRYPDVTEPNAQRNRAALCRMRARRGASPARRDTRSEQGRTGIGGLNEAPHRLTELPTPMRVAAVTALRHFDAHEAIMRKCCPHPQFVPGIEHRGRQRFTLRHQAPRRLAHGCG